LIRWNKKKIIKNTTKNKNKNKNVTVINEQQHVRQGAMISPPRLINPFQYFLNDDGALWKDFSLFETRNKTN
jgi:hypothetical protein